MPTGTTCDIYTVCTTLCGEFVWLFALVHFALHTGSDAQAYNNRSAANKICVGQE